MPVRRIRVQHESAIGQPCLAAEAWTPALVSSVYARGMGIRRFRPACSAGAPHSGSRAMYPCPSAASVSNTNRHSANHAWRFRTACSAGAPHCGLKAMCPCPSVASVSNSNRRSANRAWRFRTACCAGAPHCGSRAMYPCPSVASVSNLNRRSGNHAWRLKAWTPAETQVARDGILYPFFAPLPLPEYDV